MRTKSSLTSKRPLSVVAALAIAAAAGLFFVIGSAQSVNHHQPV
jgi:hypothetical protein